jgi:hypothetical protein
LVRNKKEGQGSLRPNFENKEEDSWCTHTHIIHQNHIKIYVHISNVKTTSWNVRGRMFTTRSIAFLHVPKNAHKKMKAFGGQVVSDCPVSSG